MTWRIDLGVIAAVAVVVVVAAAVLGGALWWRLPKRHVDRLQLTIRDPKARADIEDNYRKTIGQLLGPLLGDGAVLIGAGLAYVQFTQQQQTSQQQFTQQQQASRDLLISNQVSKGFEQLGSDKLVVRLGGIYALEGVMNTSEQYHQPVL
jgi:flagellar biosynthesis/type III secretory pathway M-ring protein FliF/YscJ